MLVIIIINMVIKLTSWKIINLQKLYKEKCNREYLIIVRNAETCLVKIWCKACKMEYNRLKVFSLCFKMCIYSIIDKIKINARELIFLFSKIPDIPWWRWWLWLLCRETKASQSSTCQAIDYEQTLLYLHKPWDKFIKIFYTQFLS